MRHLQPEQVSFLLRQRQWSQRRLAITAGIGEVDLSHAMCGRRALGDEAIARLAIALGVPVDQLAREEAK